MAIDTRQQRHTKEPLQTERVGVWHLDLYVIPRENYLKGSIMAIFIADLLLVIYFQQ